MENENIDQLLSLWDNTEEKSFDKKEFVNWKSEDNVFKVDKPIREYIPIDLKGAYGNSSYIEIQTEIDTDTFEIQLLKIDSVRLRKALVSLNLKTFPVIIKVTRIGTGYKTSYTAGIIEVVKEKQKKLK